MLIMKILIGKHKKTAILYRRNVSILIGTYLRKKLVGYFLRLYKPYILKKIKQQTIKIKKNNTSAAGCKWRKGYLSQISFRCEIANPNFKSLWSLKRSILVGIFYKITFENPIKYSFRRAQLWYLYLYFIYFL